MEVAYTMLHAESEGTNRFSISGGCVSVLTLIVRRQGCKKRAKIRSMCVHVGLGCVRARAGDSSRAAAAVAGVLSAHNES